MIHCVSGYRELDQIFMKINILILTLGFFFTTGRLASASTARQRGAMPSHNMPLPYDLTGSNPTVAMSDICSGSIMCQGPGK